MRPRRAAVALALTAVGLLAAGADGAATATLDGQRRTSHRYEGELRGTILTTSGRQSPNSATLMEPTPEDCTKESCDTTTLVLTVPRDRQSGRFEYLAEFYELGTQGNTAVFGYVALYDAAGDTVAWSRVMPFTRVEFSIPRLKPGAYRVVIYNQGAPMGFTATTSWHVNPRHRPLTTAS